MPSIAGERRTPRTPPPIGATGRKLNGRARGSPSSHRGANARRELPRLAMLAPALLLMTLFFLLPAAWVIYASMTDRALLGLGARETSYIGLDNYRRLLDSPDFPKVVRTTVVFVFGSAVIGQTGLGLLLALLIDHANTCRSRLAPIAYAAVLLAWLVPPTFAGSIWGAIFEYRHGPLNALLRSLGFEPIDMLSGHAMLSIIIADTWRGAAFSMVIFLGALQTIPAQIYEAARVDGANAFQRFRDHTLPTLSHLIAIVLMTTTMATMGAFLLILIMTNGDPTYQTETIALFAYHRAFVSYEIGFGAAISVVMLALNLAFAAVYLRIARVTA